MTIIAASIPFLRLVLREVSSKIRTPRLDVDYINPTGSAAANTTANRRKLLESTSAQTSTTTSTIKYQPQQLQPHKVVDDEESLDDSLFSEEKRGRVIFQDGKAKVQFL